jgi:hypothetical protein
LYLKRQFWLKCCDAALPAHGLKNLRTLVYVALIVIVLLSACLLVAGCSEGGDGEAVDGAAVRDSLSKRTNQLEIQIEEPTTASLRGEVASVEQEGSKAYVLVTVDSLRLIEKADENAPVVEARGKELTVEYPASMAELSPGNEFAATVRIMKSSRGYAVIATEIKPLE